MPSSRRVLLSLLKTTDLGVVVASFLSAIVVTGGAQLSGFIEFMQLRVSLLNFCLMLTYLAYWHVVFRTCNLYRSYRLSAASRELRDLAIAVGVAVAPMLLFGPIFNFGIVTVPFLLTFVVFACVGLGVERRCLRALGRRVRRYGRDLHNVIFVGTSDSMLALTARLARRDDLGYRVVDVLEVAPDGNDGGRAASRAALIHRIESLIEQQPIDELFVSLPLDSDPALVRGLITLAEEQGVTVRLVAQVASLNWAHTVVDSIDGQPVFTLCTGPNDEWPLLIKRVIDVVGAGIGLAACAPVFLLAALAVKLDSRGPVFFVQERVGFQRRRFRALKFRTMVDDAEQMQDSLEPLNEASGPVFKISNDPRVTRIGRWLRRTSIDELPQLLNVLRGEMSLVGPRPLPVRDVSRIDVRWHRRRFSVAPGITCLWLVNGREPAFDEWIKLDMQYIDNWSLALDLKILAKTIPAVLSGQGAH